MYLPQGDKRMVITPQLALRVAILGGIALVLFAVIFFRLWYLQVLSGDKYLAEANDNRVREVKVEAPRGRIVDRNGTLLVDNRTALVVQVLPERLPSDRVRRGPDDRRLGRALEPDPRAIRRKIRREVKELPFSPVTLKTDVGLHTILYLQENQTRFPGVEVERVFLRKYPHEEIGAHLFGTIGEVTEKQLDKPRYSGVALGDRVGPVRHRVTIRPLPARPERRQPRAGGRDGPAEGRAVGARPRARQAAAPVDRLRRAEDRPGGARALRHARRLRGDGPAQRRGDRARQQSRATTRTCSRRASRRRSTSACRIPTTARRSPTARPRACTRPAPRSS